MGEAFKSLIELSSFIFVRVDLSDASELTATAVTKMPAALLDQRPSGHSARLPTGSSLTPICRRWRRSSRSSGRQRTSFFKLVDLRTTVFLS